MNGSSGFRGVPMTGGGTAGGSSASSSVPSASSANHQFQHHIVPPDMNSSLRHHPPYFPRLESLTSSLYNTAGGDLAAAAAAAGRLFPTAHLSALHAAAVAAAANVPQTTAASHHRMPPPSAAALSQFHHAAAAAAAAAHHGGHHPLLSPFLYSHLSSPAAYAAGQPPTGAPPQPQFPHPRHGSAYPPPVGAESAFMPAGNAMPSRFRYNMLPTAAAAVSSPGAPLATSTGSVRFPHSAADRSFSESTEFAAAVRARRPSSPPKFSSVDPSLSSIAGSHRPQLPPLAPPAATVQVSKTSTTTPMTPTTPAVLTTKSPESKSSTSASAAGGESAKKASKPTGGLLTQPYYPSHFMKGTVIQLANGDLKRVEDLNTEDFVRSAHLTSELKIDTSQVVKIEEKSPDIVLLTFSVGGNKVQVSVEATVEHPFFVIGQGWSSYIPERSNNLYGLPCQRLQVGDVCISLTHRDVAIRASGSSTTTMTSGPPRASGGGPSQQAPPKPPPPPPPPAPPAPPREAPSTTTASTATHDRTSASDSIKHVRANDEDDRSRKRRKMNAPMRIDANGGNNGWNHHTRMKGARSACTPPPIMNGRESHDADASARSRRWSTT